MAPRRKPAKPAEEEPAPVPSTRAPHPARYVYECTTPTCEGFERSRPSENFSVEYEAKPILNARGQLERLDGSLDGNPPFDLPCPVCGKGRSVTIEVTLPGAVAAKHVLKLL